MAGDMKEVEAIRKLTDEAVAPGRARLGGWAFTRESYLSVLIPKDGRPAVEESGKYLEIFEARGHGSVEVLQSIWNSGR